MTYLMSDATRVRKHMEKMKVLLGEVSLLNHHALPEVSGLVA